MSPKIKPTRVGRRFLGMLKNAIAMDDGTGMGSLCFHLPIPCSDGSPPTTYTVFLTPDDGGHFCATCREAPEFMIFAATEVRALTSIQIELENLVGMPRGLRDFPY